LTAEVLSGDFKLGFEVFADVLLHPSFPAEAFAREQGIQLELIRSQRDNLLQSCNQAMRKALFGPAGYGLDPLGSESSVGTLRPADAVEFYHRLAVPGNCVLAVYGDVSTSAVQKAVQQAFGRWQKGQPVTVRSCPRPRSRPSSASWRPATRNKP